MKVYEALADALAREGTTQLFGLMGDANMSLWSVLARDGPVEILAARNEAGAVAMADGYFRGSGNPGVATVTCGPGLTQIGTSLMAAARNRSALVIVTGEWPGHSPNQLQVMDQRRFVESCETAYVSVNRAETLARDVAQAFNLARRGPGPVVLSVPNDLQDTELTGDWTYTASTELAPIRTVAPNADHIEMLVTALAKARRPILLIGRGAVLSAAQGEVLAIGKRIGALLGTTLQAKGAMSDQPWSIGLVGGYSSALTETLCGEADLVLGIGAEVGHYTSWAGTLFPDARLIRIDSGPERAAVPAATGDYIRADAKRTLATALTTLTQNEIRNEGFRTAKTRAQLDTRSNLLPAATDGLDPRRVAAKLGGILTKKSMLTCGVGHFQGFVAMYMPVPSGTPVEFSSQFGAVGQTLPLAIGIVEAHPSKRHLVIEGDGSLMMNIQELDTAVRSGANVTLVVWNDCGYGAEAQRLPGKGFSPETATWTSPDFVTIARGFGGAGVLVDTEAALDAALSKAKSVTGLFLIDLRVSQSERSDTYRKLFYGESNVTPLLR